MTSEKGACLHCGLPVPPDRWGSHESIFCCFGCRVVHRLATPGEPAGAPSEGPSSPLLLRLGLGIFLALNIMVASWLAYSRELFGVRASAQGADAILPALFSYLALFLSTLLLVTLGLPLLGDALRRATQSLIVIGVSAAYVLSAVHTVRGEGSLYFDTAAMVLVIVTLGSYLEAGARRRAASAASGLLAALPARVQVRRGEESLELAAEEVRAGDLVRVRPGETLPVDGRVVEGGGRLDEASLTGESRPRPVAPGDRVLAGTLALDGQLWLRAEQVGEGTVLALTERSLAAARAERPRIQRQADRVAQAFVPAVTFLAVAVFAYHAWRGDAEEGLLTGLAVLLISCPCALGLAAPLACWHGLRQAAEHGILIDSATTLERAALVDHLAFDKTGTLTRPELAIGRTVTARGIAPREALGLAAGLEAASTHPIAHAVLGEATSRGISVPDGREVTVEPGLGLAGRVSHRELRLGSARWASRLRLADDPLMPQAEEDGSSVLLMDEERILARFELAETPREGAAEAVADLRHMGIEVRILSGDREGPTCRLGERLGIPAQGELLPAEKVRRLTEARVAAVGDLAAGGLAAGGPAAGGPAARGPAGGVAMVGDGINDAPVLAAADVGIAMGSASDLARRSGHVRLLADRLDRVPLLFAIARDVRRRIRANLLGAFAFNTVGIALAVAGWLTPVFAALAMVLSSLSVVWISSRAGGATDVTGGATPFGNAGEGAATGGATPFGNGSARGAARGATRLGTTTASGLER